MLRRSPRAWMSESSAATDFSTGADSPVSADSFTLRRAASSRRRSAGTTAPASSATTSPRTSSDAGTVTSAPSRRASADGAAMALSAARAFSARYSCTKPITALRTRITAITMVSSRSPISPETTAAARSTSTRTSANWPKKIATGDRRGASTSTLGPFFASLAAASTALSPPSTEPKADRASAGGIRCQTGACASFILDIIAFRSIQNLAVSLRHGP